MEFKKIILCTEAPANTGLAYYYYLAFKDILPAEKIVLIDEGCRKYEASFISRVERKLSYVTGKSSVEKMNQLIANCDPSGQNVIILFNTSNIRHEEIKKLSEQSYIYMIHLLSDSPFGMYESRKKLVLQTLSFFDLILMFAKPLIPVLYQLGAKRVERLPFGFCRYTHFISDKTEEPEFPDTVYYFGTWTPEIEKWLAPLKIFDLHIEGGLWKNATDKTLRDIGTKPDLNTDKRMAVMARKAGVVVNFTRASHGCFHTMKTFELTAAGGCVTSNYSDEQAEFFEPGYAMSYFNTIKEMQECVDDLLINREKNSIIRNNALQSAQNHSYHERSKFIVKILDGTIK
jgi:glycosyl transferase family 1